MRQALLLDTCAVIWLVGGERLAQPALTALEEAYDTRSETFVSPISAWEVGLLISRGRLRPPMTPQAWLSLVVGLPGVFLCRLTAEILVASCFLPGAPPRDPADRIIAATARELGTPVVTRDRLLLAYAEEGHMRAIAC